MDIGSRAVSIQSARSCCLCAAAPVGCGQAPGHPVSYVCVKVGPAADSTCGALRRAAPGPARPGIAGAGGALFISGLLPGGGGKMAAPTRGRERSVARWSEPRTTY